MTPVEQNTQASNVFARFAPVLLQAGYSPIPIEVGGKRPVAALGNWSRFRNSPMSPEEIAKFAANNPCAGIGVVGGYKGLVPIDIDTDDPEIIAAIKAVLPKTDVSKRGLRGMTPIYRCIEPISARKLRGIGGENLFEILTTGQTVLPPSRHPQTGQPYEWSDDATTLFNLSLPKLPLITPKHIADLCEALSPWTCTTSKYSTSDQPAVNRLQWRKSARAVLSAHVKKLRSSGEGSRNRLLFEATCAIGRYVHNGVLSEAEVEEALLKACAENGLLSEDGHRACVATIASGLRTSAEDSLASDINKTIERDSSLAKVSGSMERRGVTGKVDTLVDFAQAPNVELFHSVEGTAFADIAVDDHRETWAVKSSGFKRWLRRSLYRGNAGSVGSEAMATAISTIESIAIFDGEEREVFLRVAQQGERIFLDLCDGKWRAVEIDKNGWRIVEQPDVRFRRNTGMAEIPEPVRGGRIEDLRHHLNFDDNNFIIAVSWVLAALRGRGPYPILALSGEQGTGKSLAAKVLRSLIDPYEPSHSSLPRDVRDLYIGAMNRHVLAFDNLSSISRDISDCLCRLATGGGFTTRALFTDSDETVFNGQRPIMLTSIGDVANRSDLADRLLMVCLKLIRENERRTEADCLGKFEAERPKILGALLDVIAHGLQQLPHTQLVQMPRMADYATWAAACETAIWTEGTFVRAYNANRGEAIDMVLESDPVAITLIQIVDARDEFTCTPAQLLEALNAAAPEHLRLAREFPNNPRALSARLARLNPALRGVGIFIEHFKESGTGARRLLRIQRRREA